MPFWVEWRAKTERKKWRERKKKNLQDNGPIKLSGGLRPGKGYSWDKTSNRPRGLNLCTDPSFMSALKVTCSVSTFIPILIPIGCFLNTILWEKASFRGTKNTFTGGKPLPSRDPNWGEKGCSINLVYVYVCRPTICIYNGGPIVRPIQIGPTFFSVGIMSFPIGSRFSVRNYRFYHLTLFLLIDFEIISSLVLKNHLRRLESPPALLK